MKSYDRNVRKAGNAYIHYIIKPNCQILLEISQFI